MIDAQELRTAAAQMQETMRQIGSALNLDALQARQEELQKTMNDPDIWNDPDRSRKVNRESKGITDKMDAYRKIRDGLSDFITMMELAGEEEDASLLEEASAMRPALEKQVDALRLSTMLSGKFDDTTAILAIHAGAGGTEAMDWAAMLLRMYMRWGEREGYDVTTLDYLAGEEAGVKSVTLQFEGTNAYGYLKGEKGVHRLVRISPFDSSARRHTSFASVDVMPELDDPGAIEINPKDLRIDTYRSSGAGGQHVNKTESAIRITHLPTNTVVQCQNERSQIQNRETAMKMLMGKLLALQEQEELDHLADMRSDMKKIEWGSQIRSYVFNPYNLVKDHRTGAEMGNIQAVMDGDLELFINEYLRHFAGMQAPGTAE